MSTSGITIKIKDLRLRTLIGFNPEELIKKQDVILNITVEYPINPGILTDSTDSILNYKTLTKQLIQFVEENQFLLLEKMTAEVLALCCEYKNVKRVCVEIEKPHALRFADSVSASMCYEAD